MGVQYYGWGHNIFCPSGRVGMGVICFGSEVLCEDQDRVQEVSGPESELPGHHQGTVVSS